MKLIVGLGNPGPGYALTRHNVGFILADMMAIECRTQFVSKGSDLQFCRAQLFGQDAYLVKPTTFMNRSGQPTQKFMNFYKILPEDLIVLHDDLDLEFGKVKMRAGGGHGGHNGIRDLLEKLGAQDFWRIKVGIGRPEGAPGEPKNVADWVLSAMDENELSEFPKILEGVMARLKDIFKTTGHIQP